MPKCPYCEEPAIRVTCGEPRCQLKRNRDKNKEWMNKWKRKNKESYRNHWRSGAKFAHS